MENRFGMIWLQRVVKLISKEEIWIKVEAWQPKMLENFHAELESPKEMWVPISTCVREVFVYSLKSHYYVNTHLKKSLRFVKSTKWDWRFRKEIKWLTESVTLNLQEEGSKKKRQKVTHPGTHNIPQPNGIRNRGTSADLQKWMTCYSKHLLSEFTNSSVKFVSPIHNKAERDRHEGMGRNCGRNSPSGWIFEQVESTNRRWN